MLLLTVGGFGFRELRWSGISLGWGYILALIFRCFFNFDFRGRLEHFGAPKPPKIDPKSTWNSIFSLPFFRTCFALDFGVIVGSSKPEKHWFYQQKQWFSRNLLLQTKLPKALISGSFCNLKSMKKHHNFVHANDIAIFFQFSWNFTNFRSISGSKIHSQII